MTAQQIYALTNTVTTEVLGSALVNEDLSNTVDVGNQVFNASAFDQYVKSLVNQVGKMVFVDRPYRGSAPSVLMSEWEYGSVVEKISSDMPVASENESWDLTNNQSYNPHVFNAPAVTAKFFNKMVTFEIDRSITEMQVKQSFQSANQLNAFISMLFNEVEKALTVRTDALIMRTINNMIGETFFNLSPGGTYTTGNTRAVNLLKLYNDKYSSATISTAAEAVTTPSFIRFAAYIINLYADRLTRMSTLFNIGGKERFTPKDMLHVVMLSEFKSAADVFLQSDTYHEEFTRLVKSESVPYWQAPGEGYDFGSTSALNITTATGHTVTPTGIIGVMFDRDALGVMQFNRRVTTMWNPKAEFTNYFYKQDARYFNDTNENFIVFYAL